MTTNDRIRVLREALEAVTAALDDASSVVDRSDDEAYAYQHELELARRVLEQTRTDDDGGTPMKPTRENYWRQLADQYPRTRQWSNGARGLVVVAPLEDGPRIIAAARALGLHVLHEEPRPDDTIRFEVSSFARRRNDHADVR